CPRIVQAKAANVKHYLALITQRTTLSSGVVKNVQESEVDTLIDLLLDGRPVHTGVAIYTLDIGLDGTYRVSVKVDKRITVAVNVKDAFRGTIANAENIGKTSDELVEMWNEDHPDDLIKD
ncbi:MAG: hypothetical protein PVF45_09335, partial [Anaerolineae bacterium]